jgi:protoporphyrinogen oxidase
MKSVRLIDVGINPKILILGAGPCGLGAAWNLHHKGYQSYSVFESLEHPGGLASSYVDEKGFTWDVGGHVQFSHYPLFDQVMDEVLPGQWYHHQRQAWVWMKDRFIPYPFQSNLWRLDEQDQKICIEGLQKLAAEREALQTPQNFGEWIDQTFGRGLSDLFMRPYNKKVWAYSPEKMSAQWVGERVTPINLEDVLEGLRQKKDRVGWGPNATFRFPMQGGTGAIWSAVAKRIPPEKISFGREIVEIDAVAQRIRWRNRKTGDFGIETYDVLLSTLPLTYLCRMVGIPLQKSFLSSSSHIVGVGVRGETPQHLKDKSWIYFPEINQPFYRTTVFSNYSPHHVPVEGGPYYSLMTETASSVEFPLVESELREKVIQGLIDAKLLDDQENVVSVWSFKASLGYPTPFLGRDEEVHRLFDELKRYEIYSRGRFGAWKYEVSNQDHTFMQGHEWAEAILGGSPELTVFDPARVNGK